MCAVMAQGRSAFKANGSRSASRSFGFDPRQRQMAVHRRGHAPAHACRPAARRPPAARLPTARPKRADREPDRSARGPVADDRVRAGHRQVEHRRARPRRSRRRAIQADQRAGEPAARSRHGVCRERRRAGGRMGAPVRRPQPGHAAAFLIHHQHRVAPAAPSRSVAVSAASCAGVSTLRANRMTPQGGARAQQRRLVRISAGPAAGDRRRCRRQTAQPSQKSADRAGSRPWRARARRTRWPGRCRRSRRCAAARRSGRRARPC